MRDPGLPHRRRAVPLLLVGATVIGAWSTLGEGPRAVARAAAPAAASEAEPAAGAETEPAVASDTGDPRVPIVPPEPPEPPDPGPRVRVIRLRPRPQAGPFAMNLYRAGDFMHQATKDWCVAGSTQTMMNIVDRGRPNRSVAFQERLYREGRRLSPIKRKLGPIGVDLIGWADLLNTGGYGPYVVDGAGTRRAAIRKAARALRLTGRPVGLVTWRGAHSWVMSGFRSTADPAFDHDYEVTAVHIQDTWYPYVSTIWGASRPPDSLVPVAALAEDYLPYRRPLARYPARDGRFMLILPTLPPHSVAR